jgi:hypothetical protein
MQNEPNFRKSQMYVNKVLTKDYDKKTLGKRGKNEPKTKPIKANKMPKQTQSNPTCRGVASGEAGSKPMLVRYLCGGSKPKKCCRRGNPHASRSAGTAAGIKFVTVLLTLLCIDGTLSPLKLKEADFWNYPFQ